MPTTEPEWRFPIQDFPQHLVARWPGTNLRPVQNPARTQSLEFDVPMAHSELTGALDGCGRYVSFGGDIRDVAEFALWCRSIVPAEEVLLFGEQRSLTLEPHTTVQGILKCLQP